MASFERVLTGRSARRTGEPWTGQPGPWHPPAPGGGPRAGEAPDPLADPVVQAHLAEAVRAAEERAYTVGRQGAEQELASAVAAAAAMAHKLETAVPKDVEMLARTVAEVAVLIARRILAAELRHDPSVLIAAIESGLRQAAGASVINVELHPMVVDTVEAVWVARHGSRHRGFSWSFSGDPTLSADGCRLRTEHGLVEAGFEDQLSEVAAALEAAIPGYLGAALGPSGSATQGSSGAGKAGRTSRSAASATAAGPAAPPPAAHAPSAVGAPSAPPTASAAVPDDLDLDALASLGLEGLARLDGLEGLDLDPGYDPAGDGAA